MVPVSPVTASLYSRWTTRLYPDMDLYFARRFPAPALSPETSVGKKEPAMTATVDPSRGRTVDMQV